MALKYELFYLIGETQEPNLASIKKEVEKMVTEVGGTMLTEEMEERRKIAYPIKKERRGVYVTKRFTLPDADDRTEKDSPEAIATLTRQLHLYRDMLRFIIVRAENLPELGEREVVPKIPRRGDSRRRDTRGGERPVAEKPAQEASKPAMEANEAAASRETVKEETKVEKQEVEEAPAVVQEEKKSAKKRVAKTETKKDSKDEVEEEKVKETEAPKKKPVAKEKVQEEEIDKKLDEILNI